MTMTLTEEHAIRAGQRIQIRPKTPDNSSCGVVTLLVETRAIDGDACLSTNTCTGVCC